MNEETVSQSQPSKSHRWQPLAPIDRRVAGVLVEKAKTTPSAYPMSLNAVVTGANQKSNRDPVMELQPEDVEESLDRLRGMGAVGLVEGYGRVAKYRHYLYEWLGVEKVEMAVMAELLLRGPQTEGELRTRASRMEPIPDLPALRPVLESLKSKGLIIPLTPEGRGHVITHALYPPNELARVKSQFAAVRPAAPSTSGSASLAISARGEEPSSEAALIESLRGEIDQLRDELTQMRSELAELTAAVEQANGDVRRLKEDLGV